MNEPGNEEGRNPAEAFYKSATERWERQREELVEKVRAGSAINEDDIFAYIASHLQWEITGRQAFHDMYIPERNEEIIREKQQLLRDCQRQRKTPLVLADLQRCIEAVRSKILVAEHFQRQSGVGTEAINIVGEKTVGESRTLPLELQALTAGLQLFQTPQAPHG